MQRKPHCPPKFLCLFTQQELEGYRMYQREVQLNLDKTTPSPVSTTTPKRWRNCSRILVRVKEADIEHEATPFSAATLQEFNQSSKQHIPKIIHQTWSSKNVPKVAIPWIKSVLRNHPDWQYMFWTQEDIRCFIKNRYPKHYEIYTKYRTDMYKADAMRYFVLHALGGFYIDLDVESLQPLDLWSRAAHAVVSQENLEHSHMLHRLKKPNVMTTVLASRPGHPFFKLLFSSLQEYKKKYKSDLFRTTGPYFLDDVFNNYIKRNRDLKPEDDVMVINSKYWLPKYDSIMNLTRICGCDLLEGGKVQTGKASNTVLHLSVDILQLCVRAYRNGWVPRLNEDAFLDHKWYHFSFHKDKTRREIVNIKQ